MRDVMHFEESRLGRDVCVTNATSEQLKAGIILALARDLCILPNLS